MKAPEQSTVKDANDVVGMEFPCVVGVKIFIKNQSGEEEKLKNFVLTQLDLSALKGWVSRESSGGKYLAVTASIQTPDREYIDAFYLALYDHDSVIMTI